MTRTLLVLPLICVAGMAGAVHPASAAPMAAGKPSITILSPRNGSTVLGSAVTVHVSVSNFKLVKPVYVNPPLLHGDQGHIHYVLDNLSNFVATRDATISLTHTWRNVTPGRHTLIAYLATSQHSQFPGTQRAEVQVTVPAKPGQAIVPTVKKSSGKPHAMNMKTLARTGGATGPAPTVTDPGSLAGGVILILLGLLLLCARRFIPASRSCR